MKDDNARMVQHFEKINDREYTHAERRDAALFLIPVFAMVMIGVAAFAVLVMGGV